MIDGIDITGRLCRINSKWSFQICGPAWAMIDFARELRNEEAGGRLYLMLANGPSSVDAERTMETMLFSEWRVEDWYDPKTWRG